jgi:hypothetical protein
VNWFPAVRTGYGALLLIAPDPVIRLVTGGPADRRTRAVVRVLGARHALQGLLSAGAPGPTVLALGVEVDLAHAVSMVGLAALNPLRRRAGRVDALCAGVFAAVGLVLARRQSSHRAAPALSGGVAAQLAAGREATATMLASWALPPPLRRWVSRP